MRHFITWLTMGILGFTIILFLNHQTNPNIYSSPKLPAQECHIIKHQMGETCVPKNPQRIVTLSLSTLGNVLSLGIKPIGASNEWQYESNFLASVKDKIEGVKIVGLSQPNLEAVLRLKPDLIIGVDWFEPIYPLLSQIAPTVLDKLDYTTWEKHLEFIADVLGKQNTEREIWNHYHQRIDKLKNALGDKYQNQKISVIYIDGSKIYLEARNSFNGEIINDAGLFRPSSQNIDMPYGGIEISLEQLEKADGDILFVGVFAKGGNQLLKKIQKTPLWKQLNAAKSDRVYYVDVASWGATHILGTDAVIDDLFKYLIHTP
jgi:iron complex transport system substrate-binding protein